MSTAALMSFGMLGTSVMYPLDPFISSTHLLVHLGCLFVLAVPT